MFLARLIAPCALGVLLFNASAIAQAPDQTPTEVPRWTDGFAMAGRFVNEVVLMMPIPAGTTCAAMGGRTEGNPEICFMDAEEHVHILGSSRTAYSAEIQVIGRDGQLCRVSGDALPSSTPYGPNLTLVKDDCRATIGFLGHGLNNVYVTANDGCRALCNRGTNLNLDAAIRIGMPPQR